jgi:hypothetical protein
MRNYFSLPQFQPGDSRINVAPVQNALEAYGNKTMQFNQIERQNEAQQYQRGRDQKQDARQDEQYQMQRQEALGKRMYAFAQQPPEKRDPRIWSALVQEHAKYHPGDGADPDDLDVMTGPDKFGKSYAAAYGGISQDPMDAKIKQADLAYKQAQTSKLYADAKDVGGDFGKTGTTVQGPDGKFYTVRYKSDGTHTISPLEIGGASVTPDRGVDVVGDTVMNKTTGQAVGNVGDALSRGETAKVIGRETGEGRMQLPKSEMALKQYEETDGSVMRAIADARKIATENPTATGVMGGVTKNVWGTPGFNLKERLKPIRANLGFDKLQNLRDNSPTGGALGQVAVQELDMLQSTYASLEQAQTKEQFIAALDEIQAVRTTFKRLKREAYQRDVSRFGAGAVPNPEGGGQPQAAPQPTARQVPSQAAQMLRGDPSPEAIREFNEVFGPGAAEGVLNGR